jgi:hypothetical protein
MLMIKFNTGEKNQIVQFDILDDLILTVSEQS